MKYSVDKICDAEYERPVISLMESFDGKTLFVVFVDSSEHIVFIYTSTDGGKSWSLYEIYPCYVYRELHKYSWIYSYPVCTIDKLDKIHLVTYDDYYVIDTKNGTYNSTSINYSITYLLGMTAHKTEDGYYTTIATSYHPGHMGESEIVDISLHRYWIREDNSVFLWNMTELDSDIPVDLPMYPMIIDGIERPIVGYYIGGKATFVHGMEKTGYPDADKCNEDFFLSIYWQGTFVYGDVVFVSEATRAYSGFYSMYPPPYEDSAAMAWTYFGSGLNDSIMSPETADVSINYGWSYEKADFTRPFLFFNTIDPEENIVSIINDYDNWTYFLPSEFDMYDLNMLGFINSKRSVYVTQFDMYENKLKISLVSLPEVDWSTSPWPMEVVVKDTLNLDGYKPIKEKQYWYEVTTKREMFDFVAYNEGFFFVRIGEKTIGSIKMGPMQQSAFKTYSKYGSG